jgi:thiamine biosynthesis protein ThiI
MNTEQGEQVVVVRYGELFLKSERVKRRFIDILIDNIGRALKTKGITFRLENPRGRIIIHGEQSQSIAETISRVFGVVDTRICTLTGTSPEELADMVIARATRTLAPGMSFAVRAKRERKEGMSSPELAAFLGAEIIRHVPGVRVDLEHPQYELNVEVRQIGGLICDKRYSAPGGLPFGTQGLFLSLLSPGIDSPVAAWMMMKRGCIPRFLFFDAETWGGEGVRGGVMENLRRLSLWCSGHSFDMDMVPMGVLFDRMNERKIPPRFRCIICKRFMYRIGSQHATDRGALVLVTGENLGQVASQTLANLATLSEAASVPVLRPLITWDKQEIVDWGRKIGTYPGPGGDLSCRAVPHNPSTHADLQVITGLEARLDVSSLARTCIGRMQTITVKDGQIIQE